ncbi:hypothetical protein [Bdellovibrio bacteriovorus]|uniref:hypothetical protein n=1 Tax=Bdellovibrio TaxID=958 RepID=UPI0035A8724F
MKAIIMSFVFGAVGFTTLTAHAETNVEFTGSCLGKIEAAIDDTKEDESGDCINGAFVGSVDEVKGNVYSLSYGRGSCEGAIGGTADVTLQVLKKSVSNGTTLISECKIKRLEITDEWAD